MVSYRSIWKKAILLPPLLFALWLLTDNDTSESSIDHHLAVVTALRRNPPSLRVYRSLLEINLVFWGTVLSLFVWSRTLGTKMVGHLLFRPATEQLPKPQSLYQPVVTAEADELWDTEEDFVGGASAGRQKERFSMAVEEALDADYDSDGEVVAPLPVTHDPPSAASVASAALDSLLLILISLFFFTLSSAEGGRYVDGMAKLNTFKFIALAAAPMFPLVLVIAGIAVVIFPWSKRREFWTILSFTISAPCYDVTFRDGFIGDILTSSVRPLQDTAFTIFYFVSGLRGWWSQTYDLDSADLPLEKSWMLHTVVLPMCMVSPLWWRFLQNLRQSYDAKKRWPYLGNALKYFVAAEVAMFGVFNPAHKQTILWLSCFVLATLYQVWWDVFMDWELLVVDSSGVRLRRTRVYPYAWIYWTIFAINFVLRFCWTLSFLPPHYLNQAGVLSATFEGDLSHILEPTIASAEIIRRTLWGLLRVEMEAIKVGRKDPWLKGQWADLESDNETKVNLKSMKVESMEDLEPSVAVTGVWISSEMSTLSDLQILGELCLWATIFASLGLVAAAHRLTL